MEYNKQNRCGSTKSEKARTAMRKSNVIAKKAGHLALALALTLGLAPAFAASSPGAAYADSSVASALAGAQVVPSFQALDDQTAQAASDSYPAQFDLRAVDTDGDGVTENYVTGVKFQNPFGTCWAFSSIAAAETSILYELSQEADSSFDLSEHHLAWFARSHIPAEGEEGYNAAETQSGEGYYTFSDESARMNGGNFYVTTNAFAAGIGPILESVDPLGTLEYHGKNKFIETIEAGGKSVSFYSADDDWSIDDSWRNYQSYELEESYILPVPYDEDKNYQPDYVDAVKDQLTQGRAVSVTYHADSSRPTDIAVENKAQFINTDTWAHYTYDADATENHGVCIVGWDDTYSKSNFLTEVNVLDKDGNVVLNDDGTPVTKQVEQPAGDGAWIVKNSWGAASNDFPNQFDWGDDGYFYLSYYDKSVEDLEAFNFYTEEHWSETDVYYVDQYDTAPSNGFVTLEMDEPTGIANVFVADDAYTLRSVSCFTSLLNTTVNYAVFLVDDTTASHPDDGIEVASGKATFEYGGFHHLDLDTPVALSPGQKYAVVEILSAEKNGETSSYVPVSVAFNKAAAKEKDMSGYNVVIVNAGESLLGVSSGEESEWDDWTVCREKFSEQGLTPEGMEVDNLLIKVYLEKASRVSFDANGGTGAMADVAVSAGASYTAPTCAFTAPDGMEFSGWLVDGVVYQPGDSIEVAGDVTLVAQWKKAVTPAPSPDDDGTSGDTVTKKALAKTGDDSPVAPIAVLGFASIAAVVVIRRRLA